MISAWPVGTIRRAEAAALAGCSDGALMQRAAAAVAAACVRQLQGQRGGVSGRRVLLLIGAGNNGGDALFAGAALARRGAKVEALLLADRVHPGGLDALRSAGGSVLAGPLRRLPDLIVDGIVGLASTGGLRPAAVAALAEIARTPSGSGRQRPIVVSVDLPSGLNPDSGELPDADAQGRARYVQADVTVSLGARTPCLLLPPAAVAAGEVVDVDLGFRIDQPPTVRRLQTQDLAADWPSPVRASQKYTRGVLGVVAGSATYPGAAVLVVGGALRGGALGAVRFVGSPAVTRRVLATWPEVIPGQGRVQAWVCGPGIPPAAPRVDDDGGEAKRQREWVLHAVAGGLPTVADAGALAMLPERCGPQVVLTPHAGELAALLTARGETTLREEVEARPVWHAQRAVDLIGATVLLKGSTTVVVDPAGVMFSQAEATPWLATAGAGDVLAGVLGGLLAAGVPPASAAAAAASVHGRAARQAAARGPIVASDVIDALPGVVKTIAAM